MPTRVDLLSVELLLGVRDDLGVRGGIRHAREQVALLDLGVAEEGLVALVPVIRVVTLRGARGASTGTARPGELDSCLLGGVENVRVSVALKQEERRVSSSLAAGEALCVLSLSLSLCLTSRVSSPSGVTNVIV